VIRFPRGLECGEKGDCIIGTLRDAVLLAEDVSARSAVDHVSGMLEQASSMNRATHLESGEANVSSYPEAYERRLVPALFGGWAASLVELAALGPGQRVLDVACGTGIVARLGAAKVGVTGLVIGLDIDPAMISGAREMSTGMVPEIGWCEGDAQALPFLDESFEVVLCQQGLQFFSDGVAALEEMHRILAPKGRLAVSVWRGVQHAPARPRSRER
jgi:SAM-dependent methyltransferase